MNTYWRGSFFIAVLFFSTLCIAQFGAFHTVDETDLKSPYAVRCMDVDGDGVIDVVSCSSTDNKIVWYTNDGQGGSSEQHVISSYPQPYTLEVADINGDGRDDLLVAGADLEGVRVSWLENTGGIFLPPVLIALVPSSGFSFNTYLLATADMDGDGDVDVLIGSNVSGAGEINWYPNNGNGSFGDPILIANGFASLKHFVVGKVDADDLFDVVVTDGATTQHNILLIKGTSGGGFSTPQQISQTAEFRSGLALGDVNGDGTMDIASPRQQTVVWLLNDGNGGFNEELIVTNPAQNPQFIVTHDMNMDGDLDILVGGLSDARPALNFNNGNGTFGGPKYFASPLNNLYHSSSIDVADLNGDLIPDVVVSYRIHGMVAVYLHDGAGNFAPPKILSTLAYGSRLADMNNDGTKDWVSTAFGGISYYPGSPDLTWGRPNIFRGGSTGKFCHLDVDNDGDLDAVYGTSVAYVALNDGDGGIASGAILEGSNVNSHWSSVHAVDVDNDGDLDVIASEAEGTRIYWYENPGIGPPFTRHLITTEVNHVTDTWPADLNGDDHLDLVHISRLDNKLAWYANDGSGNFGAQQMIATFTGITEHDKVRAADMNGDGHMDVVAITFNACRIYLNDGAGGFTPSTVIVLPTIAWDAEAVDMDGDGHVDMVCMTQFGLYWLRNEGNGSSFQMVQLGVEVNNDMRMTAIDDVDGDGDPDILLSSDTRTGWLENLSNPPFSISGSSFADLNENGAWEADEPAFPYVHIGVEPSVGFMLTNSSGAYEFNALEEIYSISASGSLSWWQLSTSPGTYLVDFSNGDSTVTAADFGFSLQLDTTVVVGSFVSQRMRCNESSLLHMQVRNMGSALQDVEFRMQLDPLSSYVDATPSPSAISGDTLFWQVESFSTLEQIQFTATVQYPGVEFIGQVITHQGIIQTQDGQNNTQILFNGQHAEPIVCAYDPNDKLVDPKGFGPAGAVDVDIDNFTYTIRFQNTGSDTARNVMLIDQLDTGLDPSTLQILGSSHVITGIEITSGDHLHFHFNGIQLPDSSTDPLGSQGYVSFRISPDPEASHGTQITNQAAIYFDQNPPIHTNATVNTLVDCSTYQTSLHFNYDVLTAPPSDSYQWFLNGSPIDGAVSQELAIGTNGSFAVRTMNYFGCEALSNEVLILTTIIPEERTLQLQAAPNPFNHQVTVTTNIAFDLNSAVELFDLRGQRLRTYRPSDPNRMVISREGLSPGMYLVRVLTIDGSMGSVPLVITDH